jgi:tetratricopeptide (TPR) repeat protein
MASRRWAEAEAAYRQALEVNPELAHIWVQYGHALKEQGKLAEAEAAYRRSLALNASPPDTHLQLGHVLKLQGRHDDAVDSYLTAHRLHPDLSYPVVELQALGVEMPAAIAAKTGPAFDRGSAGTNDVTAKKTTAPAGGRPDAAAKSAPDRQSTSDRQVLSQHGLHANLLDIFDFRYYFYANSLVRRDLDKPDQHRCLTHFCLHGVDAVLPFNEAYLFEAEFYNETYLGYQVGARNAYWHWINVGFQKHWHPNRDNWLKEKLGCGVKVFNGFDFALCKTYFHGIQNDAKWVDLVTRFIETDIFSPGPHLPITEMSADFFTAVADRFADDGQDDEASSIYEQILLSVPGHQRALFNYAACLQRQKRFLQAHTTYSTLLAQNERSISCILNLAACYDELSEPWKALACLQLGMGRFPEEPRFQSRFDALADQLLTGEWQIAAAIGKLGRYREAQERVRHACEALSSMITRKERLSRNPVQSVAIVGNGGMPQCTFYRIEQKIEQLHSAGCGVVLYDFLGQSKEFLADIYKFDAVIFYRVPGTAPVISLIEQSRQLGLTTFFDIDDLIFAGEDYPGTFESFLGQITLDEYVGLKLCVPIYAHAISLCEYGIASTPALASEMAKLVTSGEAFVHRNGFGHKHERVSAHVPTPRTRDKI